MKKQAVSLVAGVLLLSGCAGVGTGGARLDPFAYRAYTVPNLTPNQQVYPGRPALTPAAELVYGGPNPASIVGELESSRDPGASELFNTGTRSPGTSYNYVAGFLTRTYERGTYTIMLTIRSCKFSDGNPCLVRAVPARHVIGVAG